MLITHNPDLLFPPKKRLLAANDYQRVFKQGKRQRGEYFTFVCCRNEHSYPRLGLAIAKRCIPLAVGRNRTRRIIRESFRHYQSMLGGIDIVVLAQKELSSFSNTFLRKDLERRWQALSTLQK